MPSTKWGITVDALQYLRNSEYYNPINPGYTLFGFQAGGMLHYRINSNVRFSSGFLVQRDFGDPGSFNKAIPIFNFGINKGKWNYNFGNIQPHIHHNLIEPLMNYENVIRNPVEGGLQAKRTAKKMNYDIWLEWKQRANEIAGRQEKIYFGQCYEQGIIHNSSLRLSMPIQTLVYHQGGQSVNANDRVATRINAAAGLRLRNTDTSFCLESFVLLSQENSETLSQPFNTGWASMINLMFKPHRFHEIALSWWFARQFVTSSGNPVFSNVNLKDVYLNRNTRQLAMLRYVFSKPLIQNKFWIDFRLEPYYDFEYKNIEMAQGLYFRYVESLNIKLPRWMGF